MADGVWPPQRLGIVGVGLIGGSVGLAARRAWPGIRIDGVDRPGVIANAGPATCVDRWVTLSELTDCDVIVLAAPVNGNARLLTELSSLGCRALVTDVGSTKRSLQQIADQLPAGLRVVGGHPMAGNETGQPAVELFDRSTWFVVPFGHSHPNDTRRIEAMVEAFGARPVRTDADSHDRLMAAVSHVPQLVASTLMRTVGERIGESGLARAGRGLVDTTRLASCGGEWLSATCVANADHVTAMLDDLIAHLQTVRGQLSSPEALERMFTDAQTWRDVMLRARHGA